MKNRSFFFCFLFGLFLMSCSTAKIKNSDQNKLLNSLKIGQLSSEVILSVGKPTTAYSTHGKSVWVYMDLLDASNQRSALTFNSSTNKLMRIVVQPQKDDLETSLIYLKDKLYPSNDYLRVPLDECKNEMKSDIIYFISSNQNLIIEVDKGSNKVISYSVLSNDDVNEYIDKAKLCGNL